MAINETSWTALHRMQNAAIRSGEAFGFIDGVGNVIITCRRQPIMRARGEATRKRLTFFLDGVRVPSKAV